jgi:hypothetical protein
MLTIGAPAELAAATPVSPPVAPAGRRVSALRATHRVANE